MHKSKKKKNIADYSIYFNVYRNSKLVDKYSERYRNSH